jgi:predicted RNA binding protein YcfA (HicA-like mRNA interferase family)
MWWWSACVRRLSSTSKWKESRLPALTGKQLIAVLQQFGVESLRLKGSHHILRHPDGRTTVLKRILRQVKLSRDDLLRHL